MEVTKSNFETILPSVKDAIDNCDFMAVDTELSGLHSSKSTEHAFETMQEKYTKHRELCSKIIIYQFGLSTFKFDAKNKKFTHKDFNFYVFPGPSAEDCDMYSYLSEISSIHFLVNHNFDFNKVFYQGIPYLSHTIEEQRKECVENKYKSQRKALESAGKKPNTNGCTTNVPEENKDFIAATLKKMDVFMSDASEKTLDLEPCNNFLRKLIYEALLDRYQAGVDISTKKNDKNDRFIRITKASDQEKLDMVDEKGKTAMDEVETAVGFRRVIDHISQSQKLVVGHQMNMDVFHMINQYFYPLPEDLEEYKSLVHTIFPRLLDTKHLANSEELKDYFAATNVEELHKTLQGEGFQMPEIVAAENSECYDIGESHFHVAGVDAFVTGVNYIGLAKKLAEIRGKKCLYVEPDSKILKPYLNKFHIFRHYDIKYMNICGPDAEPSREHVFHVNFPREWDNNDLNELFSPYGGIYVHWLNDVSALVALRARENTQLAKTGLLKKSSKVYQVKPYSEFKDPGLRKSASSNSHEQIAQKAAKKRNVESRDLDRNLEDRGIEEIHKVPTFKKPKMSASGEDTQTEEVSSTAGVFEEEENW